MPIKRIICFASIFAVSLLLSGCSLADIHEKLEEKERSEQIPIETAAEADGSTGYKASTIAYEADVDNMYALGDTITVTELDNNMQDYREVEYTVVAAELFNDLQDADLEQKDLERIVNSTTFKEYLSNPYVELTLKIKLNWMNPDIKEKELNIGEIQLLSKKCLKDSWKFPIPEIAYFDGHSEEETHYNHYSLEPGEEKIFKVGILLTDWVRQEDSLIVHVSSNLHLDNYVDLNIPIGDN